MGDNCGIDATLVRHICILYLYVFLSLNLFINYRIQLRCFIALEGTPRGTPRTARGEIEPWFAMRSASRHIT